MKKTIEGLKKVYSSSMLKMSAFKLKRGMVYTALKPGIGGFFWARHLDRLMMIQFPSMGA